MCMTTEGVAHPLYHPNPTSHLIALISSNKEISPFALLLDTRAFIRRGWGFEVMRLRGTARPPRPALVPPHHPIQRP